MARAKVYPRWQHLPPHEAELSGLLTPLPYMDQHCGVVEAAEQTAAEACTAIGRLLETLVVGKVITLEHAQEICGNGDRIELIPDEGGIELASTDGN